MLNLGDRVVIRNTLHYNGYRGVLMPISKDPEDPWDFYVKLDETGRTIAIMESQAIPEAEAFIPEEDTHCPTCGAEYY